MALQFDQATDRLTLTKYNTFKEMCTAVEWAHFEPKVLAWIKATWQSAQLKIRMFRGEYAEVLAILIEERYPMSGWDGGEAIRTAKKIENVIPRRFSNTIFPDSVI